MDSLFLLYLSLFFSSAQEDSDYYYHYYLELKILQIFEVLKSVNEIECFPRL